MVDYKAFNRFILRTPSISFTYYQSMLSKDNELLKYFSDFHVLEALYIASPVLYGELQKLVEGKINNLEERKRIIFSVTRYFSRMATRCTPFGLFAGCSLGRIKDKTDIRLNGLFGRKTRLDMHYLYSLYDAIVKKSSIKEIIDYYSNTSIYAIENKYRYIESYRLDGQKRYQISEVEKSIYLNKALKRLTRSVNYEFLVDLLISDKISREDAIHFIDSLIDSQLLVGILNQSVTGGDFLSRLIGLLKSTRNEDALLTQLIEISTLLKNLDTEIQIDLSSYYGIINLIKQTKISYEENYLFQVDIMPKATTNELGDEIIEELKSTLTFLNKITPKYDNQQLDKFKSDFYNRYETKEVPLMIALDSELGIGYAHGKNGSDISPLIDDLILPMKKGKISLNLGEFEHLLLNKINECLSLNKKEIILTDKDVEHLNCNWDDLPVTMYSMFKILRSNGKDILISFNSCGGSSGANLISRFSHLDDEIEQFVKEITKKEQELMPDVILSEIVHMPNDRIGNILLRPHLREYELLYMANSDLPEDQLIYLTDLMLSIKDNKLHLRSKKLNREIIPRLTSAHNYSNNAMPVYKFLCDIQMQSTRSSIFFSMEALSDIFPYSPRVRYKNTILSPASWTIKIKELKPLFSIENEESLIAKITELREKVGLPQYVLLSDGDNELFVDWENWISVQSLFAIIKKRNSVRFFEFLLDTKNAAVINDRGEAYLNECIVCFHKDKL